MFKKKSIQQNNFLKSKHQLQNTKKFSASLGTGRTWEDLHNLAVERDIPPPLLLQENIR